MQILSIGVYERLIQSQNESSNYTQKLAAIRFTDIPACSSRHSAIHTKPTVEYTWEIMSYLFAEEHMVASLVEALRYKLGSIPDGVIGIFLTATLMTWSRLASNRHEYHEYFLGGKGGRRVWLTTLRLSCTECLEIWQPQPPGTLRTCTDPVWEVFYHYLLPICCVTYQLTRHWQGAILYKKSHFYVVSILVPLCICIRDY